MAASTAGSQLRGWRCAVVSTSGPTGSTGAWCCVVISYLYEPEVGAVGARVAADGGPVVQRAAYRRPRRSIDTVGAPCGGRPHGARTGGCAIAPSWPQFPPLGGRAEGVPPNAHLGNERGPGQRIRAFIAWRE